MAKRNTYTPEYKAKIVIEILEGEQTVSEIASREGINVNQLKNWKKEFLENASRAFNGSKSEKEAKRAAENAKKREEKLMQKIGHLTVQVDWFKKNLKKLSDLTTRVNLVRNLSTTKELPVSTGAKLLGINRTSVYYGGLSVSQEELECKSIIDHLHTDNPTWGARQMSAQLKLRGYQVGRRKAGRYMREMDITPIYPKMNLSKRMKQAKVCPYLLRNAVIDRPNQAWSIDITYIPMKHGWQKPMGR